MRKYFSIFVISFLILQGCSSSSSGGSANESTDSATIDTTTASTRINAAASSLLPAVNASDISESASATARVRVAIAGSNDEWDTYLESANAYVLTDIFGSPDEDPAPVTRVRVLLEQFASDLEGLLATDPDIDCTGGSALSEGTTIEIAFFGEVDNGTSDNSFYDCLNNSEDTTVIYGLDAAGNLHVAQMSDTSGENTEEPDLRGNEQHLMQVIKVVYGEEADGLSGFIDLQYAQATVYNGPNDTFDSGALEDDTVFKSRSRISGEVVYDSDGNVIGGTGEFNVIKFDAGVNGDLSVYSSTTQTMGRGDYNDGGFSLLKIDSDVDGVAEIPNTFCIEAPASGSGLPAFAESANCSSLETAYAWGSTEFSFDLDPTIDTTFDDNEFFSSDDTGLIANDGSNFSIPSY